MWPATCALCLWSSTNRAELAPGDWRHEGPRSLDGRPSIPTCTPWKTDTGIAVGIPRSSEGTAGIWGLARHGRWQGIGWVLLNTDTKEDCSCQVQPPGRAMRRPCRSCTSVLLDVSLVLMSVTAVAPCPRISLPPGRLAGGELEG